GAHRAGFMGTRYFPVSIHGSTPGIHPLRKNKKRDAKKMDCRVIRAFTPVFDRLCPAMTTMRMQDAAGVQFRAGLQSTCDADAVGVERVVLVAADAGGRPYLGIGIAPPV